MSIRFQYVAVGSTDTWRHGIFQCVGTVSEVPGLREVRHQNDFTTWNIRKYSATWNLNSSTPILHRCIPTGLKAPGETVRSAYEQLNSWSVSQQLLSDLYTTWPVMVSMYFVALGKLSRLSFLLPHTSIHQSKKNHCGNEFNLCFCVAVLSIVVIAMMNWVTNIISWFICIFVTVAAVAITVILWMTYYDVSHQQETTIKFSQFEEFIRNENALYAMAIIASIVLVSAWISVQRINDGETC